MLYRDENILCSDYWILRMIHHCLNRKSMLYSSFASSPASYPGHLMSSIHIQQLPLVLLYQVVVKRRARSFSLLHSIPKDHFRGMVQSSADEVSFEYRVPPMSAEESQLQIGTWVDEFGDNEASHLFAFPDRGIRDESLRTSRPTKRRVIKREVEMQRRQKIGLANKGKVPWNKGRQHSPGKV